MAMSSSKEKIKRHTQSQNSGTKGKGKNGESTAGIMNGIQSLGSCISLGRNLQPLMEG